MLTHPSLQCCTCALIDTIFIPSHAGFHLKKPCRVNIVLRGSELLLLQRYRLFRVIDWSQRDTLGSCDRAS